MTCPHCEQELKSEREIFIKCCFECRRFGLLEGRWPLPNGQVVWNTDGPEQPAQED
jgi:hypothetical protein